MKITRRTIFRNRIEQCVNFARKLQWHTLGFRSLPCCIRVPMVNQKLLASENWFSTSSDSVWQGWGLFHSYGLILATTNIITETRTYAASTYSQIWIASGFIKENSRAGWLVGTCKRTSSIVSNRIINRIESKIYRILEHEYFKELELSFDLFLFLFICYKIFQLLKNLESSVHASWHAIYFYISARLYIFSFVLYLS